MKKLILKMLFYCHVTVIMVAAFIPDGISNSVLKSLKNITAPYAEIAGCSEYTFFSQGVSDDVRASYFVVDSSGKITPYEFKIKTTEALHRQYSMTMFFYSSPALRDYIAQSWATTVFNDNSNAKKVIVSLAVQHLPSMTAYRNGRKAEWERFYYSEFELN